MASSEWKGLFEQRDWYPKGIKTHFLLMFPQLMAAGGGVPSVFPPGYSHIFALYEDRYMKAVYDPRDFAVLTEVVLRKTQEDPSWIDRYEADFLHATDRLIDEIDHIVFGEVVDHPVALVERLVRLIDIEVEAQSYGYLTEIFTLTKDEYWVTRRLRALAPELSEEDRAICLRPTRPSFIQDYYCAVSAVRSDEDIERLKRDFFWIKTSYEAIPELTSEAIRYDAEHALEARFDSSIVEAKGRLMGRVQDPEVLGAFMHVLEVLIALQDVRKANVLRSNYAIHALLKKLQPQVAEWSMDELLSFSPLELVQLVEGTLPIHQRELIQACNRASVWLGAPEWYAVSTNKDVVEAIRGLLRIVQEGQVKGLVAYTGIVRGRACVVLSEDDFGKMNEGDILVTSMTRPEFLPVMRKASAFVTNEGGITCHAAIVARELQKPCVIGTRTATSTFKDGELIEVDAERGIIKRVL